jgi:hypothetical protein
MWGVCMARSGPHTHTHTHARTPPHPQEDRASLVHCNSAFMTFVAVGGDDAPVLPRGVVLLKRQRH